MTISILGCGWYGFPLAVHLVSQGHQVKGSTTRHGKMQEMSARNIVPFVIDLRCQRTEDLRVMSFFDCDLLIITIPPRSLEAYNDWILKLIDIAKSRQISRIIYISSTGVYGDPNSILDELSPTDPVKPSAKILLDAENAIRNETYIDHICIRFGGLVGGSRLPSAFLKNAEMVANGLAPINLFHIDDCIGITTLLIELSYRNITINAVCPHHPTRMAFYSAAAFTVSRPPPLFVAEKINWKIVTSLYVEPMLNYDFKIRDWFAWLAGSHKE